MKQTLLLLSILCFFGCSTKDEIDTTVRYESIRGHNEVKMTDSIGEKVIDFVHAADIGKASITLPQGNTWSEKIVVRLPFDRVEGFKAYTDTDKEHIFERFYSSDSSRPQYVSTYKGTEIKKMNKATGYNEIELPTSMFADNPRIVYLEWVDVYRY
ncbi:hypothetical protein [Flammeovirga sp. SubArs3]|uniref:hypothetical protein n=1 Tax=Flammeovirga sp. SubArs3 TaxID=2995316 RepID=UPI00248D04C9|nr:hypothetical protein [Flammeovirga sp. SubArs3]